MYQCMYEYCCLCTSTCIHGLQLSSQLLLRVDSRGLVVLQQINSSGTQWHVTIDIGEHVGEVKVGIIAGGVQDLSGQHLAPVPVLSFRREKYIPFESTGYHVNIGLS